MDIDKPLATCTLAELVKRNVSRLITPPPPKLVPHNPTLKATPKWGGFVSAVQIASPKIYQGKDYIVDQIGIVWEVCIKNEPRVFLDITDRMVKQREIGDERGLLSIAFHPDFGRDSNRVFVFYSSPDKSTVLNRYGTDKGAGKVHYYNRVSEFTVKDGKHLGFIKELGVVDTSKESVLMCIEKKTYVHNGGRLVFGPDRYLYITVGDGGHTKDQDFNAQNLGCWYGKILRIDVNNTDQKGYCIPSDNPFVKDQKAGINTGNVEVMLAPEVYALGFRNPWSMCFDDKGRMIVADVGQDTWEKVCIVEKASNHGWPYKEGNHRTPWTKNINPNIFFANAIYEYRTMRTKAESAIIGGVVYLDRNTSKTRYLCGDYNGTLFLLEDTGTTWTRVYESKLSDGYLIKSIDRDGKGRAYALATKKKGPKDHTSTIMRIDV